MRFQSTNYTCGPAAISNACQALGVRITEKQAARAAHTTEKEGTGVAGMLAGLASVGLTGTPFEHVGGTDAEYELRKAGPTILCVHSWNHWVVVLCRLGEYGSHRYIVVDSNNTKKNQALNGVQVLSWKQLSKMWGHGRPRKFFGIRVFRS